MVEITEAFMQQMLAKSRVFTVILLRMTDKYDVNAAPESEQRKIIWQHGRRNFELRASGEMPLVGPLMTPPYAGLAVFTISPEETQKLLETDPAVMAGYFSFEVLQWRSFPGDSLTEPNFAGP